MYLFYPTVVLISHKAWKSIFRGHLYRGILQTNNNESMQDILLENNNDLKIVNGDFDIGVSDYQQQKLIVATHKGEWKEHPEVGVGITQMIADDLYTEMLIEIKKQLEYDGMQIDNVSLKENGKLFIDGFYK